MALTIQNILKGVQVIYLTQIYSVFCEKMCIKGEFIII